MPPQLCSSCVVKLQGDWMMTVKTFVLVLCLSVGAFASVANDDVDRAADRAAIRAHIESIFQAFIDGDRKKCFAPHSEDSRAFPEGSHTPIKGIDEYMKANGIDWPKPANAA